MSLKSTFEQIRNANRVNYSNPDKVDSYLQKPYHALRLSIGIQTLVDEVSAGFENSSLSSARILELACSTGKAAEILSKKGYKVTASDIEHIPLSIANNLERISCVQLDASVTFPFKSRTFHAIFTGELIEHLFDTNRFLSECNRVLCDNGVLTITTPNLAGLQDRIGFLFGKAPRHVNPSHEYLKLHIRPFTCGLLKQVLEENGFITSKVKSNYIRFRFSSGKRISLRLLAKLFPALGGSLIVSARKTRNTHR
jgi:2-polyprenyl-3-methyl-5-hydroxy-6-metoxy-1,4-benzoquinol methylase